MGQRHDVEVKSIQNMLERILARLKSNFIAKIKKWDDNVKAAKSVLAVATEKNENNKRKVINAKTALKKSAKRLVAARAKHNTLVEDRKRAESQLYNDQYNERLLVFKIK